VLVPLRAGQRVAAAPARLGSGAVRAASAAHSAKDRLAEAVGLARAIELEVAAAEVVPLPRPNPSTLFGSGKVEEIAALVEECDAGLAIVDHAVSPVQQRNLEKAWSCKVLDRTGLILEIFGERALTREGRLQVELAHLNYQKSRLVRSWTHLERQRGGFGFLGGPGEAQIETDRRLIDERIAAIRKELGTVVKTRSLHRAGRKRVPVPVVAIVGYTNAGKSTLFNRLTGAAVSAKDQVFQTLDPTMRELRLPGGRRAVLSDTVGFISDLPTQLVAAFRATLEEVVEADLVLHVRDISHPETEAQAHDVEAVLANLGIAADADAPVLEVWNKADRLALPQREEAERAIARSEPRPVLVSALGGEGIEALLAAIDARLGLRDEILTVEIPASASRLLSWLHAHAEVLDEEACAETGAVTARFRIDAAGRGKLAGQLKRAGLG
jgi:GTP-binding protein HflX